MSSNDANSKTTEIVVEKNSDQKAGATTKLPSRKVNSIPGAGILSGQDGIPKPQEGHISGSNTIEKPVSSPALVTSFPSTANGSVRFTGLSTTPDAVTSGRKDSDFSSTPTEGTQSSSEKSKKKMKKDKKEKDKKEKKPRKSLTYSLLKFFMRKRAQKQNKEG